MKKKIVLVLALVILLTSCGSVSLENQDGKEDELVVVKDDEPTVERPAAALVAVLDNKKETIYPDYNPMEIEAKVEAYEVAADYSNIANYDPNEEYPRYTKEFLDELIEKGFMISEVGYKQPFAVYEDNQYTFNPNFVTTDSVVHLYHVIYSGILKRLEENNFSNSLIDISRLMYEYSLEDYKDSQGLIKDLSMKNAAYFYLGLELLGQADNLEVPSEISDLANSEMALIENEEESVSGLMENSVDFSQFKPRGHYTENEELSKYFKAMMLYSQYGFSVKDNEGEVNKNNIIQSILIARNTLKNEEVFGKWQDINNPISFIVENSEDLKPEDMIRIAAEKVDFEDLNELDNDDFVNYVYEEIEKLPKPKIKFYEAQAMRFMPQRAVIDNVWLQNLLDVKQPSRRPVISGLDLMGLIGNEMAEEMVLSDERNKEWEEFESRYNTTKEEIASLDFEERTGNLYRSWLWMLEGFNEKFGPGYPDFMQGPRWEKKSLNTALASWAQLKHDTILYAKQFGAEMGGFDEIEVRHFVEPSVNVYERLIYLTEFTKLNLDNYGLLEGEQKVQLDAYKDMLEFLLACSVKELNDEELSFEENDRLKYIGGEMENIFIAFDNSQETEDEFGYEIPASDRDMAIVADLMTVPANTWDLPSGHYLEVGSGYANLIEVIYRVGDKYYIGSGPVMSYYEFLSPERLDDKDFRNMLIGWDIYTGEEVKDKIEYPDWMNEIIRDKYSY